VVELGGIEVKHRGQVQLDLTAVITLTARPAMAVPYGFDQFGVQLVGTPTGESALLLGLAPADRFPAERVSPTA
jgi:Asp-tRNA(Asn)/Glu-tRNA(Gln) amidotransferase A subunit family amidase